MQKRDVDTSLCSANSDRTVTTLRYIQTALTCHKPRIVHTKLHNYVNDITNLHRSDQSRLSLYADDMLLYKPITSNTSYAEIQQDVNSIFQWSKDNMLSFNITKSKCMLLTNKHNISVQTTLLNNEPLEFVQHYKYLGVTVSHNLSWSHHIQDICKKARKVLGAIYHRISNDSLTVLKL